MSQLQKKRHGFSLTEVLIVVFIVLILAVALTPSLRTYFTQNYLKGVAEGLYDDVLKTRTAAIQNATTATITFLSGASWCYGMSTGAVACNCVSAASPTNCNLGIIKGTDFPDTSLATTSATMNFQASRGTPTQTATTTITFSTTNDESITVAVNVLGHVQICSTTVGGYSC